jgi:arylsulfatase A-like enzyme/TolA-binding protein
VLSAVLAALWLPSFSPAADVPAYLSALARERAGDRLAADGHMPEAGDVYVTASSYYCYEHLRGGFGLLSLKDEDTQPAATDQETTIRAKLLKGYLLLAREQTSEGIARLLEVASELDNLERSSPHLNRYMLDAHFLLGLACLDAGDKTAAFSHAREVLTASRKAAERKIADAATEFGTMVATSSSGQPNEGQGEVPAQNPNLLLFADANALFSKGMCAEARMRLERTLGATPVPEWKVVKDAANAGIRTFIKEASYSASDSLLSACLEWSRRTLPREYAGYAPVLAARACLLAQDLDRARERNAACLADKSNDTILAQVYLLEGRIALCQGETGSARRAFAVALSLSRPKDVSGAEALFYSGYLQLLEGDVGGGKRTLRLLTERYPESEEAMDARAVIANANQEHCLSDGTAGDYNILLVSMDTVGAKHLGCYGYPRATSPTVDKLAEEGVLFEDVTAASSWTVPSHMSMFTSLYPGTHGVEKSANQLAAETPTLADILRKQGFTTAAFVTGPSLNRCFGFDRGFEFYDDFTVRAMIDSEGRWLRTEANNPINEVPTNGIVTHLALAWLNAHRTDRFFLFVHLWDAHHDYAPPAPYDRMFDAEYEGQENGREIVTREPDIVKAGHTRDLERIVSLYDGDIAQTDACLGQLVNALERDGILDKTLVIVVSDHGEAFLEHGHLRHGKSLYQEEVRVPWVMRLPNTIPAGLRVKGNVSHVDLMPTVLGLFGLSGPDRMEGWDLSEVCRGRAEAPDRPVYSRLNNDRFIRAVRWGEYKLIEERGRPMGPLLIVKGDREFPASESGSDPVAAAEIAEQMAAALRSGVTGTVSEVRTEQSAPDQGTRELLRSLGYME